MAEQPSAVATIEANAPALPGMEPGTTPGAKGGEEVSPSKTPEKKLILGKYENETEAAKGFQSMVDTNVDLKGQLEEIKDQMAVMLREREVRPDPQAVPETSPQDRGFSAEFRKKWEDKDYHLAMDERAEGVVNKRLEAAKAEFKKQTDKMEEQMAEAATNEILRRFETDTENHPGFAELKPAIFQRSREMKRENPNYGAGMPTEDLVHMLYLYVADKNPDVMNKARTSRAAAVTSPGGGSPGEIPSEGQAEIKLESRKLPRSAWKELGFEYNPDQYKLSREDKKNIRATIELMYMERAMAAERKKILAGANLQ